MYLLGDLEQEVGGLVESITRLATAR